MSGRLKSVVCCLALGVVAANGEPIPGLFNTGVATNGTLLPSGAVDPHYRLVQSAEPSPSGAGPNAYVVNEGFPINPWMAQGPNSKWIAPMAAQGTGNPPGRYHYRTTFVLNGWDLSTVVVSGRWSSDNEGVGILINGQTTGITYDGNFGAFSPTFTINSGFVDGTNTLEFIVNNAGTTINPTGFRAELSGEGELLPPPGTPPSIFAQPESKSVNLRDPAVFSVIARGSAPLLYQWRFGGQAISGATNRIYSISSVNTNHIGNYDVIVRNDSGSITSAVVSLSVQFLSPAQTSYEPLGPSSRRTGLTFSEIMYRPRGQNTSDREFIEIYNSNPWAEDLSGYRLRGDVIYDFPTNTSIGAKGFLVIAANPEVIRNIYGITNVIGGYAGTLPNGTGNIRLRKASGGLILEVNYSDQMPWPVAADGPGHSMVLVRPSYGEDNPQAWAASAFIGGSPGLADPVPTGPLESVLINEVLSHSPFPTRDFIELYNNSPFPVDISGCWLSDKTETFGFRIPDGTIIPSQGFVAFDEQQLDFAIDGQGASVFLYNPSTNRVIDAVAIPQQSLNFSYGRWPNGNSEFRELASTTPGISNSSYLMRDLIISEIMYNPISGNDNDEYIEFHNKSSVEVGLGGWRIAGGIEFTFPAGTRIGAGAYLVVAKNSARMLTNYPHLNSANLVGNYSGVLANSGELVQLLMTNNAIANEVHYLDGGKWGKWSDGGGSSLELTDLRSDNSRAQNWADSDESAKSEWTVVEHTGILDHGTGTPNQLQLFLQGAGEALVDNVEMRMLNGNNLVPNGTFEAGISSWVPQGTQRRSFHETTGYQSSGSLHLVSSDRGDHVANRVRVPLLSPATANGVGTIRAMVRWLKGDPEILIRLKGNHLEAAATLDIPKNLGTPGLANSRSITNAAPAIWNVTHIPALPEANQPVRVVARIDDQSGLGSVQLKYRVDPSPTLTTISMSDDGQGADLLGGDGIYSASIPGHGSGQLVAFQVVAIDQLGAERRFPSDTTRECLIRFGEIDPGGDFGTYHLWITQATHDFWGSREKMSNEALDGTFVYGRTRVIYNVGSYYSGSSYTSPGYSTPTGALSGYNILFPEDDQFLGETDMVLDWPVRDTTNQREQLMFWFLEKLNLPNNYRRYVHVYVNGVRRGVIYDDVQQPNGEMINEWFSDDEDGTLWKTDCWNEFTDDGTRENDCVLNTLQIFTTTNGVKKVARYRWNWRPRAQDSQNNFGDLFRLVDAANVTGTAYESAVLSVVDMENWMKTFAMNDLSSYWDGFGNPNAKNTYLYKPQEDGWKLMSWDFDVGLGVFNDPVDAPLFAGGVDPVVVRMYNTPAFVRIYWRTLEEGLNTFFNASAVTPILNAKYAAFQANNIGLAEPSGITTWINQRRSFLVGQMSQVAATFAVTTTNIVLTNNNVAVISGTAPVSVTELTVNGIAYPVTWTTVRNWTLRVPVNPDTESLLVEAISANGTTNGSRSVSVSYSGPAPTAENSIVINEIMYNPNETGASFLELHNTSNLAFDLSGWRVNGVDYVFPEGTVILPQGFIVLVRNMETFANAYGFSIVPLAEFGGNLDAEGEMLTLFRPGTNGSEIVVDRVRYEGSAPWPAGANGQGASAQLRDPNQDNGRVANWSDGIGWRYASYTGNNTTPRFLLYLEQPGEVYIDDMKMVMGTDPNSGTNIIKNGDFESPLTVAQGGPWTLGTGHTNSFITTEVSHSGNGSLKVVGTSFAVGPSIAIWQDTHAIVTNAPYTISFWYLPTGRGTNMTLRTGSFFRYTQNISPRMSTPGQTNATLQPIPEFPEIYINEIQTEGNPWVELYNGGSTSINLSGYYLSTNYTNLSQHALNGSIAPGQYLAVTFAALANSGSVILSHTSTEGLQVLDYINYGAIRPGMSYGSYPNGQLFTRIELQTVTRGAANIAPGSSINVFINEWMASNSSITNPITGAADDWFELYNAGDASVDLSGYIIADQLTGGNRTEFPTGVTIGPRGYLLIWADDTELYTNGQMHVDFRLSASGEALALIAPDGSVVDSITFGSQTNNMSQGRFTDGAPAPFPYLGRPTPGSANVLESGEGATFMSAGFLQNGSFSITWMGQAGGNYRVQYKDDLGDAQWTDLGNATVGNDGHITATDSTGGTRNRRFYRLVTVEAGN